MKKSFLVLAGVFIFIGVLGAPVLSATVKEGDSINTKSSRLARALSEVINNPIKRDLEDKFTFDFRQNYLMSSIGSGISGVYWIDGDVGYGGFIRFDLSKDNKCLIFGGKLKSLLLSYKRFNLLLSVYGGPHIKIESFYDMIGFETGLRVELEYLINNKFSLFIEGINLKFIVDFPRYRKKDESGIGISILPALGLRVCCV